MVSDSHKIAVQLCLDVQAYAAELARVGVDAATLSEYAELQEAARPEAAVVEATARTDADGEQA